MAELGIDRSKERAIKAIQTNRICAEIWGNDTNKTIHIEFSYPRLSDNINEIKVGLSDVRASDGIKIYYDFDRDGYVILQPYIVEEPKDTYIDCVEHWEEVGFYQSWALESKNSKVSND